MTFGRRIAVLAVLVLGSSSLAAAEEATCLFNGSDFTGWTKLGGAANYTVEDGEIVGRSVPNTINTFLATEKEYGDFILEVDFKIDDPTFNSGIQIRSHSRSDKGLQRVYGYQVEIDPTDRAWSGGIYYEGGGPKRPAGWLHDLSTNEAARQAFRLGEWNHYRIVAQGRRIQTWINGVPATDYTDDDDEAFAPSGFIGLQVHHIGDRTDTKEVRWKNVRVTELD